jgi:hypothetical protein
MARSTKSHFTTRVSKTTDLPKRKSTGTSAIAESLENFAVDRNSRSAVGISDINQISVNSQMLDIAGKISTAALRRIAEDALVTLVKLDATPAAVKAACARTLLELCGAIGTRRGEFDDGADPEIMSLADIDKRLKALDDDRL